MTLSSGLSCENCGVNLTSPTGRCPHCGSLQVGSDEITKIELAVPSPFAVKEPTQPSARPRSLRAPAPPPPKKKPAWLLVPLLIVLATTVTLATLRSNRL